MPVKLDIYNQKAEKIGDIQISEKVFDIPANEALVHQAMIAQMSNERQNLAHAKTRSEVSGGGRKPWRQKGTGRARAGSNRSPIWIGGGVTFGPSKERNFKKKINKKMKQKALLMVLSDRIMNNNLVVLDELKLDEFKTNKFNEIIKNIEHSILKINELPAKGKDTDKKDKKEKAKKYRRNILIIDSNKDEKVKYSAKNLTGVNLISLDNINILDLLNFKYYIITKKALEELETRYNK